MKTQTLIPKIYLTLFATLCITILSVPAYAQWNIGGLLNISNSTVSVDPNPSSEAYSGRFGFGIGAVLDRPLAGNLELHAEPMFMQKGATIDDDGDEVVFKSSYFELPIMLRYNFQPQGNITPYAMAGPSLGYLLGAKFESGNSEFDAKDQFKSADFGVGLGGGAKIPRGNLQLFAEARYVLGFANVNDDESDGTTVKNRGLSVLFGATVPFKR